MKIPLAVSLFTLGLVMTGLVWLVCRASADLGWPRVREMLKDPPFALMLAGALLALLNLIWILTHPPTFP